MGYNLPLEVNWEQLVKEGFTDSYPQVIDYNFFVPLEKALSDVCVDDMGKDAVKAKIKSITISLNRNWSSIDVKLENGVLNLDADPTYNRAEKDAMDYNSKQISKVLEKNL